MNTIRPRETAQSSEPEVREPEKSKGFSIDELLQGNIRKYLPFLSFLAALAIIHIYNSHQAIKLVKRSDDLSREIKEARAEFISVKSELMYRSKQSQVAKRLEGSGLQELKNPPFVIKETKKDRNER